MKNTIKEFLDFLKEYNVVALAIAFILGVASTALIKSLVDNVVMPLVTPFMPAGEWQTAVLTIWKFKLGWGSFLAAAINFIIIALVVFLIAKKVIKEETVHKK